MCGGGRIKGGGGVQGLLTAHFTSLVCVVVGELRGVHRGCCLPTLLAAITVCSCNELQAVPLPAGLVPIA